MIDEALRERAAKTGLVLAEAAKTDSEIPSWRQATVTAVDSTVNPVVVNLTFATVPTTITADNVPCLGHVIPVVNAAVWVAEFRNGRKLVVGTVEFPLTGIGRENPIRNSLMRITQRGTSFAGVINPAAYYLDGWRVDANATAAGNTTWTISQVAGPGGPFGVACKLLMTAGQGATAAGSYCQLTQMIEGRLLQHFYKGSASAREFTIQFRIRTNKTGNPTFIAELQDTDNSRICAKAFTAVTGSWTTVTLTLPADATGAFLDDNNLSCALVLWFAAGSTYSSGTLQTTWAATSAANHAVGCSNLMATNNDYVEVTGVYMKPGPVMNGVELLNYAEDLEFNLRYYARYSGTIMVGHGNAISTSAIYVHIPLSVPMRAVPTPSVATMANWRMSDGASVFTPTAIALISNASRANAMGDCDHVSVQASYGGVGLTQFRSYYLQAGVSDAFALGCEL